MSQESSWRPNGRHPRRMKWARPGGVVHFAAVDVLGAASPSGLGPGPTEPRLLPRAHRAESLSEGAPGRASRSMREEDRLETVLERCAALDVHKRRVTACARVPDRRGERAEVRAEFETMTPDLLALRLAQKPRHNLHRDGAHRGSTGSPSTTCSRTTSSCSWSTPSTSRTCPVERPTSPTRTGSAVARARSAQARLCAAEADPQAPQRAAAYRTSWRLSWPRMAPFSY
jgi:hypothetical protein